MIDDFAKQKVSISYHGFMLAQYTLCLGLYRRIHKWCVWQVHRIISKPRRIFVFRNEVENKLREKILTIDTLISFASLFGMNVRIPVALCAWRITRLITSPHCIIIKTVLDHDIRLYTKIIHLPFACGYGVVTSISHYSCEAWV